MYVWKYLVFPVCRSVVCLHFHVCVYSYVCMFLCVCTRVVRFTIIYQWTLICCIYVVDWVVDFTGDWQHQFIPDLPDLSVEGWCIVWTDVHTWAMGAIWGCGREGMILDWGSGRWWIAADKIHWTDWLQLLWKCRAVCHMGCVFRVWSSQTFNRGVLWVWWWFPLVASVA